MANTRLAAIQSAKSYSSAGTETIDIKLEDVISRIDILGAPTKTTNSMIDHAVADITKIELVDGSDVLYSASGKAGQAINAYDQKVKSLNEVLAYSTLKPYAKVSIDFGRYLFDEKLALDPKKFKNPQLKITHTLVTSDIGATAYNLQVHAHVFDEKIVSPQGFLMTKEHYAYTPSSVDTYEYIELPTDYPMRKLFIRAAYDGYTPRHVIKELRLDENNDKRVPLDVDVDDYINMMKSVWSTVIDRINTSLAAGTHYLWYAPSYYFGLCVKRIGAVWTGYISSYLRGSKVTITHSATEEIYTQAEGLCPHHVVEIPFGNPEVIEDFYDVTKLNSLRLRLKAGANGSSGTVQVLTQQLRKYV